MTLEAELAPPAPAATPKRAGMALPVLFSVTAFLGAALLFLVEPLVAKLLLPSYGGAATVWATSTLFFQVVLLAAYLLVHATTRLGHRGQPLAQLPLVLVALVVLPLALPADAAPESASPIPWLLRTLALMVGLPFAVLATTGPLLQRWYAWTDAPRAHDPYFLYAASNVGSFVGLLAYPFLVEPRLSLATQRTAWSWAFGCFVLLVAFCGTLVLARGRRREPVVRVRTSNVGWPSRRRLLLWVGLAFLPSSLMLGVTTHISTDVAAIPLLWVIPLAVYLATMVAAFAGDRRQPPLRATQLATVVAICTMTATLVTSQIGVATAIGLDLLMLAVVGFAAHAKLAADRPATVHLTHFYVAISVGGALGGLVNGILAPQLLDRPLEYPLVLAVVPLLYLGVGGSRKVVAALCVVMLGTTVTSGTQANGDSLERSRTFYGSYIVREGDGLTRLFHGTTLHGMQFRGPGRASEPTSYYARSGPLGDVFAARPSRDVVGVGLGAGTIAAYGEPGQRMTFIEIDPEVIRIARDTRHFSYLSDSAAAIETVAGDGRLAVESMAPRSLDLLVLDAFSSDSIPLHLLTSEAMRAYAGRMRDDGVVAVHISNRVFDLRPVLTGAAESLGWRVLHRRAQGSSLGASMASWVVLTPDDEVAERLTGLGWSDLEGTRQVHWTDDYSSVLAVLD